MSGLKAKHLIRFMISLPQLLEEQVLCIGYPFLKSLDAQIINLLKI